MALLGSILIDSSLLPVVAGIARPDDFYRETHRTIYAAMCELSDAGTPPDLITVCDELARRGKLDEVGGASYVSSLANKCPPVATSSTMQASMAAKNTMRSFIEVAGQIAALAQVLQGDVSTPKSAWSSRRTLVGALLLSRSQSVSVGLSRSHSVSLGPAIPTDDLIQRLARAERRQVP